MPPLKLCTTVVKRTRSQVLNVQIRKYIFGQSYICAQYVLDFLKLVHLATLLVYLAVLLLHPGTQLDHLGDPT